MSPTQRRALATAAKELHDQVRAAVIGASGPETWKTVQKAISLGDFETITGNVILTYLDSVTEEAL